MKKSIAPLIAFLILLHACLLAHASVNSPVEEYDLELINTLFKKNNIKNGYVGLDEWGRVELKGEYENEEEVEKAFEIAQSIVGTKWLSRVTPDKIKVRKWELEASQAFLRLAQRKKLKRTPPGPVDNIYALVVGIGVYKQKGITKLEAAPRDAELFAKTLMTKVNKPPEKVKVIKLINEQGTKANILNALDFIRQNAKKDDMVILYFATHGTQPDKDGFVRIITYDTEFQRFSDDPYNFTDVLWKTSLTANELYSFLEGLEAMRVVFLYDVCYSGSALKNIPGLMHVKARSIFAEETTNQGVSAEVLKKKLAKARDLYVEEAPQPANQPAVMQAADWGSIFIAAADEGQQSWENPNGHGFFTIHFVNNLIQQKGDVKNAFLRTKPAVERDVMKYANKQQTPQMVILPDNPNTNLYIPFK